MPLVQSLPLRVEGTDLAAINDDQGAVAVIFELVNPSESYLIAEYRWFWPIRGIRWFESG